jgi:HAE1 family hydrophobic/amphiphilic exporter-1
LYESFIYPVVIMISVPMAAVGGFAALRLQYLYSGQRLDTLTMLGFIILIGTVVNNAILIVNQALNYIRVDGWHHREAVTESVRGRIRPIFMSTMTTVLGMLPLVLLPGAGSELYRGLGSVVVGGLLISTIFTLFLVPMLFAITFELREYLWARSQRGRRGAVPTPQLATAGAPLPAEPLENMHSARAVVPKTPDAK